MSPGWVHGYIKACAQLGSSLHKRAWFMAGIAVPGGVMRTSVSRLENRPGIYVYIDKPNGDQRRLPIKVWPEDTTEAWAEIHDLMRQLADPLAREALKLTRKDLRNKRRW